MAALYDSGARGFSVVLASTLSTGSFTIAGSNRVLYVFVASGAGAPAVATSVKWNTSEAATDLGVTISNSVGRFAVWRLIAPTATTSTVDVVWGSNQDERLVIAVSFKDVDQATPNNTIASAGFTTGSSAATVNATSVSGDLVVDCVYSMHNAASNFTIAVNGGQTSRQEIEGADTGYEALGSSTLTATGTSTTMPWTISGTPFYGWAMFAFALNGASGVAQNKLFYYKA